MANHKLNPMMKTLTLPFFSCRATILLLFMVIYGSATMITTNQLMDQLIANQSTLSSTTSTTQSNNRQQLKLLLNQLDNDDNDDDDDIVTKQKRNTESTLADSTSNQLYQIGSAAIENIGNRIDSIGLNNLTNDLQHIIMNGPITASSSSSSSQLVAKRSSAINEFPPDFMNEKVREKGGFIIHILIFCYLSLVLAVICDFYFLKSLELISDALNIPSDIAGATFMAIGTSAPELFTSIIGVFISDNDIGTGTIVGSAVFNLIAIPGACGFAAYYNLRHSPKISSFPIIRDTIFYVLTIITLILCIKDNQVDWIESITLLCLYAIYITIMYFNAQVSRLIRRSNSGSNSSISSKISSKRTDCCCCCRSTLFNQDEKSLKSVSCNKPISSSTKNRISPPPAYQATGQTFHQRKSDSIDDGTIMPTAPLDPQIDYSTIHLTMQSNGRYRELKPSSSSPPPSQSNESISSSPEPDVPIHFNLNPPCSMNETTKMMRPPPSSTTIIDDMNYDYECNRHGKRSAYEKIDDEYIDDDDDDDDWTQNIIIRFLLFPFRIIFCFTLPPPSPCCFALTFISSIAWISALTYLIVWMVTLIGYTFGIPDTVSGITILAAGTSIPELISSYFIVKRAGLADMAICNSIGSNIFDILFCLGLPWLLKTFIMIVKNGFGFATLAATSIPIQSTALPLTSLTLLLTIGAMLIIFNLTRWRLSLSTAILCSVVYVSFVIISTLLELNV
ncbi:hypothetical protein RDWZM_010423 [Blomia tropicalis]|uniref:Sodium/calcium exchanger membrane region domain-containing protein n=1 Tax=Blomia tropicalis TaxID=40697 RepID=A0A9Q0LZF4_BLOTA|nr:hypothetical protein RDWZM_010423 [Blomia tropicalis]